MRVRPRVLLIAEAANPESVSVPLLGWSIAEALRRVADVHIVTQIRNRDAILRAGLKEGIDFTAIDSEAMARPLWKFANALRMGQGRGWTTVQAVTALSYAYFEHLAWKRFGSDVARHAYDIVHRVTPLTPTKSSLIAPRCKHSGVPFVLGPLNGGVPWPKGFDAERRQEGEWFSYFRSAYRLLPGLRRSLSSASAILVGSSHTQSEIPESLQPRCIYLPENGIDPKRFFRRAKAGQRDGPLRVCFIGRMVPYKGPDMLIEASIALLRNGSIQLDMVGDGPLLLALQELARSADVDGAIKFHGWIEHRKVQEILVKCDVLGFPSIREFGGGVVLEAMALGVPPVVVDYAGPGELVRPGLGYKVPLGNREEITHGLSRILTDLTESRQSLVETGARARRWAMTQFTWERKAEQILAVYSWVMGGADKPAFFDQGESAECADT